MTSPELPTDQLAGLLVTIEIYYDAAPRPLATTEEIGPFTLFVKTDPTGWPYYARRRLGLDVPITTADVNAIRERQRELEIPQAIEWVHETTPSLLSAARADGMTVQECPLLVLRTGESADVTPRAVVLAPDSPDLAQVVGAIGAGFQGTDEVDVRQIGRQPELIREGLLAMVAAYDGQGAVVGGGSHSPRGTTTELTGIAVLPRARRRGVGAAITHALVEDAKARGVGTIFLSADDDAVARVYERVGFVRVGTACIAELSAPTSPRAALHPDKSVEIRFVSGGEWETWRSIRLRALQDAPNAFGATYEGEIAFTESDFRDRLDGPGPAVIAFVGDEPVGMGAGYQNAAGWLHIVAMWVDPASRGHGVGRLVLDELVGWAGEHGQRAHLDVATGNSAARRFYERYGFVATGETRPLRPGSNETIERMDLPG